MVVSPGGFLICPLPEGRGLPPALSWVEVDGHLESGPASRSGDWRGSAHRTSLFRLVKSTHLLVGIDEEMIEVFDPDQAEARKFQVSNDVERC